MSVGGQKNCRVCLLYSCEAVVLLLCFQFQLIKLLINCFVQLQQTERDLDDEIERLEKLEREADTEYVIDITFSSCDTPDFH